MGNIRLTIQVDRNITAIMKLPCVNKAEKLPSENILYTLIDGNVANEGDLIHQGQNGTWYVETR